MMLQAWVYCVSNHQRHHLPHMHSHWQPPELTLTHTASSTPLPHTTHNDAPKGLSVSLFCRLCRPCSVSERSVVAGQAGSSSQVLSWRSDAKLFKQLVVAGDLRVFVCLCLCRRQCSTLCVSVSGCLGNRCPPPRTTRNHPQHKTLLELTANHIHIPLPHSPTHT